MRTEDVAISLLLALATSACGGKPSLESPIREVGTDRYYTATGRAEQTGSHDFTEKLAWLSAASELSRARSTEVYVRLTREQRSQIDDLLQGEPGRARRDIEGRVNFIDEATSDAPLRNVHELRAFEEDGELLLTLGVPMETWQELVDEAAEEVEQMLEAEVVDLEGNRQ